jgi:hypothetical protein
MNLIKNYELNEDYLDKQNLNVNLNTEELSYQERLLNLLHVKSEMNSLQFVLVLTGIVLVAFGLLANLSFSLLMLLKKRFTLSNILMISMCLANIIYLIFYSFKLSIYAKSITKYHVYDTLDPWPYGELMCQLTSGLVVTCKLIVRLSILGLALVRILSLIQLRNRQRLLDGSTSRGNFSAQKSLLGYPLLGALLVFIWLIGFLGAIPVYSSFKLTTLYNSTETFCDSTYNFPEDLPKVAFVSFTYLVLALGLPCLLILFAFIIILILHLLNRQSFDDSLKSKSNWLLVILYAIHLITTLPHDLSKYVRLSVKYELDNDILIDEKLLESVRKPIQEAKTYYELQYLYISEFVIIPFVLILFFVFSTKKFTHISSILFKCCDCNETEEYLNERTYAPNENNNSRLNGADERLLNDSGVRVTKVTNPQQRTSQRTANNSQSVSFTYMQSSTYKN